MTKKLVNGGNLIEVVTQYQIGALLRSAYGKAATAENAVNGFRYTGICSIDADMSPGYMHEATESINISVDDSDPPGSSLEENFPVARTVLSSDSGSYESKQCGKLAISVKEYKQTLYVPLTELCPIPVGVFISR